MREPTSEECSNHTEIEVNGRRGFAAWYPQMGGYSSHCIIVPEPGGGCFDAYVWHDGDFPFGSEYGDPQPREMHHCDPDQFIGFGELANELADIVESGGPAPEPRPARPVLPRLPMLDGDSVIIDQSAWRAYVDTLPTGTVTLRWDTGEDIVLARCPLCGIDAGEHTEEACLAKAAAWKPRGIFGPGPDTETP